MKSLLLLAAVLSNICPTAVAPLEGENVTLSQVDACTRVTQGANKFQVGGNLSEEESEFINSTFACINTTVEEFLLENCKYEQESLEDFMRGVDINLQRLNRRMKEISKNTHDLANTESPDWKAGEAARQRDEKAHYYNVTFGTLGAGATVISIVGIIAGWVTKGCYSKDNKQVLKDKINERLIFDEAFKECFNDLESIISDENERLKDIINAANYALYQLEKDITNKRPQVSKHILIESRQETIKNIQLMRGMLNDFRSSDDEINDSQNEPIHQFQENEANDDEGGGQSESFRRYSELEHGNHGVLGKISTKSLLTGTKDD